MSNDKTPTTPGVYFSEWLREVARPHCDNDLDEVCFTYFCGVQAGLNESFKKLPPAEKETGIVRFVQEFQKARRLRDKGTSLGNLIGWDLAQRLGSNRAAGGLQIIEQRIDFCLHLPPLGYVRLFYVTGGSLALGRLQTQFTRLGIACKTLTDGYNFLPVTDFTFPD